MIIPPSTGCRPLYSHGPCSDLPILPVPFPFSLDCSPSSLLFCCMPAPSLPRGLHFQSLFCQIIHSRPLCGHCFSPFGLRALMPQRGSPHLPYLRGPGTIWSNLSMVEFRKKFSFFAQKLSSILFSQISLSSSFMAYWVDFMSLKYVLIS